MKKYLHVIIVALLMLACGEHPPSTSSPEGSVHQKTLSIPGSVSKAVYWLSADYTTNTGDGTQVTAATDQGYGSNTIVAGGATGPTYLATGWQGSKPAINFSGQYLKTTGTGSAVVALLNGQSASSKKWTVKAVWQPRHQLAAYPWSWSKSTASSRHLTARTVSNTYKTQVLGGSTGSITTTNSTVVEAPAPQIDEWRRDGSTIVYRHNGVDESPVTWTASGNYDVDSFFVNASQNTPSIGQAMRLRHLIVFDDTLTSQESADWDAYFAEDSGLDWMGTLGNADDWLIMIDNGQSNRFGYCASSGTYTYSVSDAWMLRLDGMLVPFAEPYHLSTDDASPSLGFSSSTATYGAAGARIEQLRALGETRKILVVPGALISTSSASWKVGLTSSPPSINDLIGYSKQRVDYAIQAGSTRALVEFWDQWEANTNSLALANAWDDDHALIRTEFDTRYSGLYDKATHAFYTRAAASVSGIGGYKTQTLASQDAFAIAYSNILLVQGGNPTCEGTPGLHRTGAEQQTHGVLEANTYDGAP